MSDLPSHDLSTRDPWLELTGISVPFGGVQALDGVDFDVRPGEIHALIGENGAGKSTLMKVAAGIHRPNAGRIAIAGQPRVLSSPRDAWKAGIAMVHQELSLAPDVSVMENLFIGREPRRLGFIDWRRLANDASDLLGEFGLSLDPTQPVSQLTLGYRQVVEILRALSANPRVIIFDEPTSALESQETAVVLRSIQALAARSIGVVYISHRLEEIVRIAHRITILRDGKLVWTKPAGRTHAAEMVNDMVGRDVSTLYPARATVLGDEILRLDHLTRQGHFRDISFTLRRGEILGFSGLVGSGRTQVMRAIFGAEPADSGAVLVARRPRRIRSVADAIEAGIAYVPEDRKSSGLFLERSVHDNILGANLSRCSSGGIMRASVSRDLAAHGCARFRVKCTDSDQEVNRLSGGNQQKVLLARWMATHPEVLIVDEPTRGVDVAAKSEIHRMLRDFAAEGHGVFVVASEMPEVIGLCDRIIVLHEGQRAGEVSGADATEEQLIRLAMGNNASEIALLDDEVLKAVAGIPA